MPQRMARRLTVNQSRAINTQRFISCNSTSSRHVCSWRISVLTAYEIRSGNPFKKYNACDYRLEEPPMQIAHNGVSDMRPSGQRVDFIATATDFHLEVSGFDLHRDLKLKMDERSEIE